MDASVKMSNEELLGYTEIHSKTERALFSPEHANRLLEMAGWPDRVDRWVSIGEDVAEKIIKAANENGHGRK